MVNDASTHAGGVLGKLQRLGESIRSLLAMSSPVDTLAPWMLHWQESCLRVVDLFCPEGPRSQQPCATSDSSTEGIFES